MLQSVAVGSIVPAGFSTTFNIVQSNLDLTNFFVSGKKFVKSRSLLNRDLASE